MTAGREEDMWGLWCAVAKVVESCRRERPEASTSKSSPRVFLQGSSADRSRSRDAPDCTHATSSQLTTCHIGNHSQWSNVAVMSSRKDELLAKKAKLAELKRQRELREEQRTTGPRHSIGGQVRTGNLPASDDILT